jgi:hypothetical protein
VGTSIECRRRLRHAIEVAASYALVLERLDRLVPGSETPRSELVNSIGRALPMKVESWLGLAAVAGIIELTKAKNRWQVCKREG